MIAQTQRLFSGVQRPRGPNSTQDLLVDCYVIIAVIIRIEQRLFRITDHNIKAA